MKNAILFVFFITLSLSAGAQININGPEDNLCVIGLKFQTLQEANELASAIEEDGGRVGVIVSTRYMLGWVDSSLRERLASNEMVTGVYNKADIMSRNLILSSPKERAIESYFSKQDAMKKEAGNARKPPPWWGKVSCIPEIDSPAYMGKSANPDGTNQAETCIIGGNSERMVGTVSSAFFFVESDGSEDPNLYTWSEEAKENVLSIVISGLVNYSFQAGKRNKKLTFTLVVYDQPDIVNQPYEPITTLGTADAHLWINSIMENLGFGAKTGFFGVYDNVQRFNTHLRNTISTDWAYSSFIAYNPKEENAPDRFAGGMAGLQIAWATLGGPYLQLTYDSLIEYPSIFVHEMAHVFHAYDEYIGSSGCDFGFNGVLNSNHRGFPCYGNDSCVMFDSQDWTAICKYTEAHIGWKRVPNTPSLIYPSEKVLVSTERNIAFTWERKEDNPEIYSYLTIVNEPTGEPVYCENDPRFFQSSGIDPASAKRIISLPPGDYIWYVTNGGLKSDWAATKSQFRSFTVKQHLPSVTTLHQNFPNPFNPETTIRFHLTKSDRVTVKVYDLHGKELVTLLDNSKSAGSHEVVFKSDGLPSGIYFYRIETSESIQYQKMLLMK